MNLIKWPPPMPSEKEIWMARYVHTIIMAGFTTKIAFDTYYAGEDDHNYSSDPVDAANEELSYWDDDGDLL